MEDCGSDVSMLNRAAQKANFPIEIEEACEPDRERFLWTDMSDMTSKQWIHAGRVVARRPAIYAQVCLIMHVLPPAFSSHKSEAGNPTFVQGTARYDSHFRSWCLHHTTAWNQSGCPRHLSRSVLHKCRLHPGFRGNLDALTRHWQTGSASV